MQCLGNIRCVITPDNLPDFLALLGLAKTKSVWHKAVGSTTLEVDAVLNQEQAIAAAQAIIAAAPARKQAIMQRYL
jgi:hypothetical protein